MKNYLRKTALAFGLLATLTFGCSAKIHGVKPNTSLESIVHHSSAENETKQNLGEEESKVKEEKQTKDKEIYQPLKDGLLIPPDVHDYILALNSRPDSELVLVRLGKNIPLYLVTHKDGTQIKRLAKTYGLNLVLHEGDYRHHDNAFEDKYLFLRQRIWDMYKKQDQNNDSIIALEESH